ncbi:MAG: IS66 family insertion sequence element accessory protein TnpA [Verrucomicrobiota bacterium]
MSQEERLRLLEAFDRSGLTQRGFCKREGINFHTFVTWLGWRRHQPWRFAQKKRGASSNPFREVVLKSDSGSPADEQQSLAGLLATLSEEGGDSQQAPVPKAKQGSQATEDRLDSGRSKATAKAIPERFEAVLPDGIVLRTGSAEGLVAVLRLLRGKAASC